MVKAIIQEQLVGPVYQTLIVEMEKMKGMAMRMEQGQYTNTKDQFKIEAQKTALKENIQHLEKKLKDLKDQLAVQKEQPEGMGVQIIIKQCEDGIPIVENKIQTTRQQLVRLQNLNQGEKVGLDI